MIWIGTSGWVYKHWIGRFYPPDLPQRDWLRFYARHFPTVEINRSFYRLPTREQFDSWREQVASDPEFFFAVKASRFITQMKKLRDAGDGVERLVESAEGLGTRLGPFLYQLPPRWHATLPRLAEFIQSLPHRHRVAFEFRDTTWFQPEVAQILADAGCALVIAIGGVCPTPLDYPLVGPFSYVRFHHGAHGIGLSNEEIGFWANRIAGYAAGGRDVYVYFNNDPDGHAIVDAYRLQDALGLPARERT